MIKFDFQTFTKSFINIDEYNDILNKKNDYIKKLKECSMTGWLEAPDKDVITDIKITSKYIKDNFNCLIVVGIGGSYLGSYAFDSIFKSYFNNNNFEVIYAGTTLSSKYLHELSKYIQNKNVCLYVISKSGSTLETSITYKFLKDELKRKYKEEELKNRIILCTNDSNGKLFDESIKYKYKTFTFPKNIGGRYSFMTPAHLLPLSLNYNLDEIIEGYLEGQKLYDVAFEYATTRFMLFKQKKYIENFCVYEENLGPFTEWLKQLFAETEGKNGKGVFPVSTINTRDLHSLGQFIQEGNKIIFETFIKVANSDDFVEYQKKELQTINNIVLESVINAHYKGGVPILQIELTDLDYETISTLMFFFMLSAAFSALLFEVDPFNQPGVEVYKSEVKKKFNN
ncbi:MAG: glucose-6-phosphate isomerase [Bacilli bacterium]|nr:glucose-6-phosphate isomerase [Bacilli bacterium]